MNIFKHLRKYHKPVAAFCTITFLNGWITPAVSGALYHKSQDTDGYYFEQIDSSNMVSRLTGDLTYAIPLIEIPGPAGNYPLSLSYNSENAVNTESSWVGLGWALTPGSIDRYVNGYPDDHKNVTTTNRLFWEGGKQTYQKPGITIEQSDIEQWFSTGKNTKTSGALHYPDFKIDKTWLDDHNYDTYFLHTNDKSAVGSFINYDDYQVTGQGLSGTIRPYQFKKHLYAQNIITSENEITQFITGTNDYAAAKNTQWRFTNDFSNRYQYTATNFSSQYDKLDELDFALSTTEMVGEDGKNSSVDGESLTTSKKIKTYTNQEINEGKTTIVENKATGFNRKNLPPDQIGAYTITDESGVSYHYTLPAYSYNEYHYSENTSRAEAHTYNELKSPEKYAYTWHLTAITGPDYVDRGEVGKLDQEDYGYWVDFEYGKWTDQYFWRTPQHGINKKAGTNFKNYSEGVKEIYYLDAIKTKTHTALFVKSIRKDNKSNSPIFKSTINNTYKFDSLSQTGYSNDIEYTCYCDVTNGAKQDKGTLTYKAKPTETLKLDKIILLTNKDVSKITKDRGEEYKKIDTFKWSVTSDSDFSSDPLGFEDCNFSDVTFNQHLYQNIFDSYDLAFSDYESKSSKIIRFDNDHYNIQSTTNNSIGKLTLSGLQCIGKAGQKIVPDVTFEYTNGSLQATTGLLETVTTSLGGKIAIEYETSPLMPENARVQSIRTIDGKTTDKIQYSYFDETISYQPPTQQVIYGRVREQQSTNNSAWPTYKEYVYETNHIGTQGTYIDHADDVDVTKNKWEYNGKQYTHQKTNRVHKKDFTSRIGVLKSITEYDQKNRELNKIIHHYLHDELSYSENDTEEDRFNKNRITYTKLLSDRFNNQGVFEETFVDARLLFKNNQYELLGMVSKNEQYPVVHTGITTIDYKTNIKTIVRNIAYDYYSSKPTHIYSENGYNNYVSKAVPAYRFYKDMGKKHVLDKSGASYTYRVEDSFDPNSFTNKNEIVTNATGLVSATVQTWSKNIPTIAGSTTHQEPAKTIADNIYQKHKVYTYVGQPGTALQNDGTYPKTKFTEIIQPTSTEFDVSLGWQQYSEVALYDVSSHPLEIIDVQGIPTATRFDTNNHRMVASAPHTEYTAFAHEGAENSSDGTVKLEGTRVEGTAHTGTYSISPVVKKGFSYKINKPQQTTYAVSFWSTQPTSSIYYQEENGIVKKAALENPKVIYTDNLKKEGWYLISGTINVNSGVNYVDVWTEKTTTSYTLHDDFRVHPLGVSVTANVYNQWGELSDVLNSQNLYTHYEYDAVGHIKSITQENFSHGIQKTSDVDVHYKKSEGNPLYFMGSITKSQLDENTVVLSIDFTQPGSGNYSTIWRIGNKTYSSKTSTLEYKTLPSDNNQYIVVEVKDNTTGLSFTNYDSLNLFK